MFQESRAADSTSTSSELQHSKQSLYISTSRDPSTEDVQRHAVRGTTLGMWLKCVWFYRSREVITQGTRDHREVFMSDNCNVNPVESIMGPVRVISYAEFMNERAKSSKGEPVFIKMTLVSMFLYF